MKPVCEKCKKTHWTDQACKVEDIPLTEVEELEVKKELEDEMAPSVLKRFKPLEKPRKVLSAEHLAKLKAGRDKKRDQAR